MDNQSNPPTDPPSDQFQNLPVRTYHISSLSRKKRKKLRIQLNTELQRVKAMIRITNIKAVKMKKPKIKAAKIKTSKTEAGSHQVQNVLPQNLAKLIDRCNDDILKRLRKYPYCKHLNKPVFVEGIELGEAIGLNEIANKFKGNSYKSPFQFAVDMRSACNHAINYDERDEVVKVASQVLDKVNELIEPILVDWKKLMGGVEDEEIWKESTDVEAEVGEKSGDIGENGVSDSERGDDAGYIDFNASDSDNDEDDALG